MTAHDGPKNRLAKETSPYLRQHAGNPVDWFPWGPEALELSKSLDKPIFLSIGYSACHWCHVMEHESFENPEIAALLNSLFVNIKVDREERPDIDAIYMQAVLFMNEGQGGWPMSVFLTPELKPFFGGTYYPPTDRYGRPGFPTLARAVANAYATRRSEIEETATELTHAIGRATRLRVTGGPTAFTPEMIARCVSEFGARFDQRWGGTGGAPKFPPSSSVSLLLRAWKRHANEDALGMAGLTLQRMSEGGMYDQLGGGFSRYSVDERWEIPHFEKMLYDNAQLIVAYAEGFAATGVEEFRRIAREIFEYIQREMTSPEGGFYSSQDADSEGEEGKFFAWTLDQFSELLIEDAEFARLAFGVTKDGNFEHGTSALTRRVPLSMLAQQFSMTLEHAAGVLASCRLRLFDARESRIKPHRDEKILTAWNGLMITGLVRASRLAGLGGEALALAARAADFLLANMFTKDGRLHAVYGQGHASLQGYLDCHAFLAQGLLELAGATGNLKYFESARRVLQLMVDYFSDSDGGFFFTASDHEKLIVRGQDPTDHAIPSGNSVAATVFIQMAEWTGEDIWRSRANQIFSAFAAVAEKYPSAFPSLMLAADLASADIQTVVVSGKGPVADELYEASNSGFHPYRIVLRTDGNERDDAPAILQGKAPGPDGAAAYICRGRTCQAPVYDAARLRKALDQ